MNREEKLQKVFDKTDGCCHLCHKKLCFGNYGIRGAKGNWQIEHSIAKANGGTDHLNNLFPACITCNLNKGINHTKSQRKRNGQTRAPYSRIKKEQIRENNTWAGATGGALLGLRFGPYGALIGGIIGGLIGDDFSPKK